VLEAKIPVLEKRMALNQLYVGVEGAFGLAAAVVIIAGARRLRALPVALGLGAFAFWLSTAGAAGVCFGAGSARAWIFALLGLIGAASLFGLAPSESSLTAALRARLGLPASPIAAPSARPQRRLDLVALLGASLVGLWLPASLDLLGKMRVSDSLRLLVFVGTCFVAFVGFLGFRPERAKTPPSLRAVLLAGALGFGTVTAADLAAQAGMLTVVETQQCFAPARAAKLEEVQKTAQKETTGARRQSQTQALAMLIALLAAPISEEMLYRGAFQRVARRALGGRWATLGSGLLFAVAHSFAFPTAWYNHVALGLAFAAIFEMAGGTAVALLASAAAHLLWNGWLSWLPV
jgi:membrane protease YdiL (CAAX protease family)